MRRTALSRLSALLAASALLTGCGSGSGGSAAGPATAGPATSPSAAGSGGTATGITGGITVFAAASLTESFTVIGKRFEAAHPGTSVRFSFASSSTLATQITQGAPADVFASASPKNLQQVVDAKAAGTPVTFAENVLEVAVPAANPAGITQLADLARPGVKVAVCATTVPAGAGALQVFKNANLTVTPVTIEADVKATLSKVTLGEVDAGVVWVTDVLAAGDKVKGIPIPAELNHSSSYPIATLTGSANPATAKAFVDHVLSADGATALAAAGFAKP